MATTPFADNALARIDEKLRADLQRAEATPVPATKDTTYYRAVVNGKRRNAYASDLRQFVDWAVLSWPFPCSDNMLIHYLTDKAAEWRLDDQGQPLRDTDGQIVERYSVRTLRKHLAAIGWVHRLFDYYDPTSDAKVRQVLRGIRLDKGIPDNQALCFSLDELRQMLIAFSNSPRDTRDKALLLVGVFGAFRQGQLTKLAFEDLTGVRAGIAIELRPDREDPKGRKRRSPKRYRAIPHGPAPFDPAGALLSWISQAHITAGPIFRSIGKSGRLGEKGLSHTSVNTILRRAAARGGLVHASKLSAHSMRASFIKIMRAAGISDSLIAQQTDHADLRGLDRYDTPTKTFKRNAAVEFLSNLD